MQVSVETTSGLERKMTVEVPAEEISSAMKERMQSIGKTARIKGFRPGKIPLKVLQKRYGPQVRMEVIGDLVNSSYDMQDKQADVDFTYTATFEVYPEFEPRYDDSISVEKSQVDIEESDIDDMLDNLLKQRTEYEAVQRKAENDDQIIIDFVGSLDGEEFDGGKAEKAPLVLGSGAMIPGFEDQLTGVTVKEAVIPEPNEELIKSFGIEDGTIESLRADIQKNMERELEQRLEAKVKQQVMDGLLEINEIDVPVALPDVNHLADELFSSEADKRVRLGLVIGEIVRRDGIRADSADVRKEVERMAATYQEPQHVIDYYYNNAELLQNGLLRK